MRLLVSLLLLFAIGCSNQSSQNLSQQVDDYIAEDRYEEALELIENTNPGETKADLSELREKTHLNYGIYLEYRGPEDSSMRDRMTAALEQYIEVLNINTNNEKARSEIQQIMSIYQTMPDRSPGEKIMKDLRALGFDY